MAFIPTSNAAKLVVGMELNGVPVSNTLWFTRSGTFGSAELDSLNDTALTAWIEFILPLQSSELTLLQMQSYDMSSVTGPMRTLGAAPGEVGGNATTNSMPGNVAAVITKRTDTRGRSGRGRIYHTGLTEGQCAGNSLTAGVATAILQGYNDFFQAVENAEAVDHVIVSFFEDGVARSSGLARLVTNLTMDESVDTQRRRLT